MSPTALTTEQVEVLLNLLEAFQQKPGLFVVSQNLVEGVYQFLIGVRMLSMVLSGFSGQLFNETASSRGWLVTPKGLIAVMKEAGLSDKAIIDELISIEVETYKRIFSIE